MSYITIEAMIERFGTSELVELTDRDDEGVINERIVNQAIADADAEIDGYIGAVATLPLTTVPATLVRVAADIARYRLYDEQPTEAVRKRYEDARAYLRDVAGGKAVIASAAAQTSESVADYAGNTRVFTEDTLEGF